MFSSPTDSNMEEILKPNTWFIYAALPIIRARGASLFKLKDLGCSDYLKVALKKQMHLFQSQDF